MNTNNLYDAPSSSSSTGDYSTSSEISNSTYHTLKNFTIGDRVFLNRTKQHGTIAYIGPTHFSAEDLVGLVLDSSSGKHDGSVNGIRYFQCPAKRGLFCPISDLFPVDQRNSTSRNKPKFGSDCEASQKFKFQISDKRTSSNLSSDSYSNHFDRFDRKRHSFRLPKTTPLTDDINSHEVGKFQRSWSERSKSAGKLWDDSEFSNRGRIAEPYDIPKAMKVHRCKTLPGNTYHLSNSTLLSNSQFIRSGSLSRIKQNHEIKKSNTISEITSISASKLYDQQQKIHSLHDNNNNNTQFKVFNSKYSSFNYSTYTPNHSLFNVQFRNSLRLIKWKNKLNKHFSTKPVSFNTTTTTTTTTNNNNNNNNNNNDNNYINMINNLINNSQINQFSIDNDLLLMNNVINCAQERLSDLQNQVLQYHTFNVKLSKQLTFVKTCQQEILCKLGNRQKNDVLESQQTNQLQNKRIQDIKSKLFQEYKRLHSLAGAFNTLNITNVNNNNQNCNNQTNMNNCYTKKNRIVIATVHPLDDNKINESNNNTIYNQQIICNNNNNNNNNLKSQLDNTSNSLEIMKLRRQQLNIYEAYQCHYQKIFKKLSVYQQILNDQMYEVYEYEPRENLQLIPIPTESMDLSNSHSSANELYLFDAECNTKRLMDSHKSIYREHQLLLREAKEKNHKLSMEISVMNAEITHLASRPERQLSDYLKQLESCKSTNDNLHQTIQNLEEQIVKIHKRLEEAKDKLNKEDNIHLTLLRMNLRIHQLKQMEIKAHSLQYDQSVSIQIKEKELIDATNKMDLLSQVWANERQFKIETIQKLRENLKFLSDNRPKAHVMNKANRIQYSGTHISDMQEPSLPYSLFSALCKEIRRLQSRSVSLVEALDLLSTGSFNAEKLDHIKSLVLSSNQTKAGACVMNWKSASSNNVCTNIKRSVYANMDARSFNSVRSVKLRNNGNISLNTRSSNRHSNVYTSTYNKHVTISDNRKHKVSSCKNSADSSLKNVLVQEPINGNIAYPDVLTNSHTEKSLPSPAQQQYEQQQDLVHDTNEEQPQQPQHRLYHYNLSISYSPRVQRRPVSFYLSRSLDKFVKMPIPEADEEQTDEDVEEEGEDGDDDLEEENKKETGQEKNTERYDNLRSCHNHELSKESTMILISNQS
ncbi:hypothetical protein MN116_003863 [Schistosoma mekongi]|uniref:CAP-Gly domain-containing protein n=1 Tax=Schistosoma mekongi TaxID=38744 RepID=A0AAE2D5W2_SCHME|nr:hypothetical protein MN116_003863 [Schistosoma mekongi]